MRLLVAGAGSIGRRHTENLLRLDAGDVAVFDPDARVVGAVTTALGVKGYATLADALDAGPEAVLVCTPTHRHLEVARAALEAGAHVFIEKPVALSLEGVAELGTTARERGRVVAVGCNMRFHPGVAALRTALAAGVVGRAVCVRARFSHFLPSWRPGKDYRETYSARRAEGGGILLEGVHEIDYVRWLGGEVATIGAWAARLSTLEIDAEDCATVQLRLAGGAAGLIHLDALSPVKRRGCEIIGETGVLRWTSEGKAPEVVTVTRETVETRETILRLDAYDGNAMYLEELRCFLAATRGAATPLAGLDDGRRVLEIALRARAIAEGGR
jgi:predicted dehydrogenase